MKNINLSGDNMLTEKQVMETLTEFEETEIRFKELHKNFSEEDILEDFERDFCGFNDFSKKIEEEIFWYSPIAEFKYPRIIKLNESGLILWNKLVAGADKAELVSALLDEYDITGDVAEKDVDKFIGELRDAGAIED